MARIIIADDDKLIHIIYSKIIDVLGHEMVSCYNGREVIEEMEKGAADLIILDNRMPEMDGYEACQAIRKMPQGITIPIIIVSADDSQESILRFLNAGANDYILKPISETILIAKLKNFLNTVSLNKNELEMVRNKVVVSDRYLIKKVLGYGTHSVVFLALDKLNDNIPVALKLLNHNILSDELIAAVTELTLHLKEAELENVIRIHDFGQYAGSVYIVLEYADGGDLSQYAKKKTQKLTETDIVQIGCDLSKALVSMENNSIIHLDVKPENIMIHNGKFKFSDFGLIYQRSTATMPLKPEIWGTPAYSSPEVLMDDANVSISSDVYSLGVVFYEYIIGDNPFIADKPAVSMFRQLNLQPTSLLELKRDISTELSILIDMMLNKKPDQRPSPRELQSTFEYINACLQGTSGKELTYLDTAAGSALEEVPHQDVVKVHKKVQKVVDNISSQADAELHTQRWENGLPFHVSSLKSKAFQVKKALVYILLGGLLFAVLYFSASFVASFLMEEFSEEDIQGVPAVVICDKCGYVETKPVVDIRTCKCPKCGGQEWYAVKCSSCGKYYPLNEDKFNDDDFDGDDIDALFNKRYTCPFCGKNEVDRDLSLER